MIRLAVMLLGLVASPALGQTFSLHVTPDGSDNADCAEAGGCSPKGAIAACRQRSAIECGLILADGVYVDPEINVYYHRTVSVIGNCKNPGAVVLRATKNHAQLIIEQDHAIGTLASLTLEAGDAKGVEAISARQHTITDFESMVFGEMNGGSHLALTEYSIASCAKTNTIAGGAHVHIDVSDYSKVNINCPWHFKGSYHFDYFYNAVDFSKINAALATYVGDYSESTGIRCNSWRSSVYVKIDDLPGDKKGNCSATW